MQGVALLFAADKRIPFFVGPPGAMSHERARVYASAVSEARLVTCVGFPAAYTDVAREAREFLGTNTVPLALGWWLRPARESAGAAALLWSEASVLVDALRFFCGEVSRVHAFPATADTEPTSAGGMVLHLQFARGTTAVLTLATFSRPEPRVELELSGPGWSLTFDEGFASLRVAEPDKTTILRRLGDPAAEQAAAFLEAVATGEPGAVPTSYRDALRTLAVCDAAAASAREGRAVEIPPAE
jgi:predicted dehydrogenase